MLALIALVTVLFVAVCGYAVFVMIVQWILSDAPVGTKILGISNKHPRQE